MFLIFLKKNRIDESEHEGNPTEKKLQNSKVKE
jgi:hypothetical protein